METRRTFHWLTGERWGDFERLFGLKGAYGGCWCMFWRQTQAEYNRFRGEANRQAMRAIVEAGERPGILAYLDGQPAGWMALAPRSVYGRLARARVLAALDDTPVWSITCFYIAKNYRRQGLMTALLRAAVDLVQQIPGSPRVLEGYPVEPRAGQTPDIYAYTGLASAFRKAGFVEAARRSPTRPIMRYSIPD